MLAAQRLPSVLLVLLASAQPAHAGDMTATCPSSIPESSFATVNPPAGWIGSTPNRLHLSAVGMMAGPPDQILYLVPNRSTRDQQVFEFEPGYRQRWLWCSYGPAQLSRRLDDAATVCTVSTTWLKQGGAPTMSASVACR